MSHLTWACCDTPSSAISDFTAEVGATQVVPGSHLWDDYHRRPAPDEITQAVMPAGSGMIYTTFGSTAADCLISVLVDIIAQYLDASYLVGFSDDVLELLDAVGVTKLLVSWVLHNTVEGCLSELTLHALYISDLL